MGREGFVLGGERGVGMMGWGGRGAEVGRARESMSEAEVRRG